MAVAPAPHVPIPAAFAQEQRRSSGQVLVMPHHVAIARLPSTCPFPLACRTKGQYNAVGEACALLCNCGPWTQKRSVKDQPPVGQQRHAHVRADGQAAPTVWVTL
jgi:hypothetical protein